MRLEEVTWRHRNDFSWRGVCEHCSHEAKYGDGYADNYYCTVVVPNRYCPGCGKNSYGKTYEDKLAEAATNV